MVTSPTEQRRAFDAAINRFRDGDTAGARHAFTQLTAANATMTDAWLGRVACGDHSLDALGGAYTNWRALYRETRRLGLKDGELQAAVTAPLYVTIEVWSRGTIAVAYASVLIAPATMTTPWACSPARPSPPTIRPRCGASSSPPACIGRRSAGPT